MIKPQISVVVITYNQEDLIGRALDSILKQIEHIYEIIVADDCSQDATWEKVHSYEEKYPDIVKGYRNSQNLGIVGNIQFTWTKITGNLIYYCSGDDVLCDGLLLNALRRMEHEVIDYDNDAVAIYCDFATIRPDGSQMIFKQYLVEKYDAFDIKLRGLLSNRSMGYSKGILSQLKPVDGNLGMNEDGLLDAQIQLLAKKNYYFSFVGSKYYSCIGISSRTSKIDSIRSSIETLEKGIINFNLSGRNAQWVRYSIAHQRLSLERNLRNLLTYLRLFVSIIELQYGFYFVWRETKKMLRTLKQCMLPPKK